MGLPTTTFRFILYFAKKQWWKFSILILADMIWALNNTLFPYFIKRIVNTLSTFEGERAAIYAAISGTLAFIVVFWVLMELVLRAQGMVQVYLYPYFRANIRKEVFQYIKRHSHEYFSNHFAGHVSKKISDLPNSSQSITEIICFQFISGFTAVTIVFFMMWSLRPIFALILIVWLIFHLGLMAIFLRQGHYLWKHHADSASVLSGKIVDALSNMMNVRLFARGQYEMDYLNRFQQDEINKAQKAMWRLEIARVGMGISGLFNFWYDFYLVTGLGGRLGNRG